MNTKPLYHLHETVYCTQYRELKERSLTAGPLLVGTPGTLHPRNGTGYAYCYRVFYPVPGIQSETLVGRADDRATIAGMRQRMEAAEWMARQVSILRKAGYLVADKQMARTLVELHNLGAFATGLVAIGALAIQAWLNELGAAVRLRHRTASSAAILQLGVHANFLDLPLAARLPLVSVDATPAMGIRLGGLEERRVSIGVAGSRTNTTYPATTGSWIPHTAPGYDYLLDTPESAAILAGGHCVPVLLPSAARLVWYTLFECASVTDSDRCMSARALALALAAALIEQDPWTLLTAWEKAPPEVTAPIRSMRPSIVNEASAHPELCDLLDDCLR